MSQKGKIAVKAPKMIELETGKSYKWCSCGETLEEPFCDSNHKNGTSGLKSLVFTVEKNKSYALCQCKQTNNPPYCDGSHAKL